MIIKIDEETVEAANEAVPGLGDFLSALVSEHRLLPTGTELLMVSDQAPIPVSPNAADSGKSGSAARSDHQHSIPVAAPSRGVGAGNQGGTSRSLARADHGHALHEKGGTDLSLGIVNDRTVIMRQGSELVGIPFFTKAHPSTTTKSEAQAGTSEDVARSDHEHDIATDRPVNVCFGSSEAEEGTSSALARADHIHSVREPESVQVVNAREGDIGEMSSFAHEDHTHQVQVGLPTPIGLGCSEGEGDALARADHGHSLVEEGGRELTLGRIDDGDVVQRRGSKLSGAKAAVIGTTAPAPVGAKEAKAGTSGEAARADHAHDVEAGDPISVGGGNKRGESAKLALADHSHAIRTSDADLTVGNIPDGSVVTRQGAMLVGKQTVQLSSRESKPKPADAGHVFGGVSDLAAREDHKHGIPVGKPKSLALGGDGSEGSEAALSRADHVHPMPAPGKPETLIKDMSWGGQSTKPAREDHRHDIATGRAISVGQGNAEGEAESFARSDHDHAFIEAGGNEMTLGAIGDNQLVRRVGNKLMGTEAGDVIAPAEYGDGAIPVLADGTKQLRASGVVVDDDDVVHAQGFSAKTISVLKSLAVKGKLAVNGGARLLGRVVLGPGPEKDAGKSAVAVMGKAGEEGLLVYSDGRALDIRSLTGEQLLLLDAKGELHVEELTTNGAEATVFTHNGEPIPGNVFGAHYTVAERKLPLSTVGNVWASVASLDVEVKDGTYRIGWQFAAVGACIVRVIVDEREIIPPCAQTTGFASLPLEDGKRRVKVMVQSKGRSAVKVSHGSVEFWRVK